MSDSACILDAEQRFLVTKTVAAHCTARGWQLHVVNCRSNHIHVVVSAGVSPKRIQIQLKAWCTRRLKELEAERMQIANDSCGLRERWWAERGSRRWINDEASLDRVIAYVREAQDQPKNDRLAIRGNLGSAPQG